MSAQDGLITCRTPTVGDAIQLAQVATTAWQVGFRGLLPQVFLDQLDTSRSLARWRADLVREREAPPYFLVVEQGGVVVGFSAFGPSRDLDAQSSVAELFAIHVAPTSWGRGAGSELLQRTMSQFRASGFSGASLWVIDGNARARTFYERHGWHFDGTERTTTRLADFPLRELRYQIDLGP